MESEKPPAPDPDKPRAAKIVHFDEMPKVLRAHREGIRSMMQDRCAMPGSPIPLAMANRAADWIMMLTVYRANRRRIGGREPFPDKETIACDIENSATSVELLFLVAAEEVQAETPIVVPEGTRGGRGVHLLVPQGTVARNRAGRPDDHDPERGLPGGESEGPPGDDGPAAA